MTAEPEKQIPGGIQRKSVFVDREELPAIVQRERINQLLLAHDLHTPEGYQREIKEEDLALIRQIAREGAVTNIEPVMRQRAILLLGTFPTVENLNLLTELARYGEDFYVRSYALLALGKTGLLLAGPVLSKGLSSADPIESNAAEKALTALGRQVGMAAFRSLFEDEQNEDVRQKIERVLANLTPAKASEQNHLKQETMHTNDEKNT
jgi:HEAT repeat protein